MESDKLRNPFDELAENIRQTIDAINKTLAAGNVDPAERLRLMELRNGFAGALKSYDRSKKKISCRLDDVRPEKEIRPPVQPPE